MDEQQHPLRAYRHSFDPPLRLAVLAARVGTSKAVLSKIENGKQPVPQDLIKPISVATGLAPSVLRPDLAEIFQPQPEPAE